VQSASDPRLRARLARLELRARTVVEGLRGGRHRSPVRGSSSTFAQHREYVPGDDIRHLDWRLMARGDRNIVREFEEETDLHLHVVLDASASMAFGEEPSKLEFAGWLAATLARIACDQRDLFGLSLTQGEELVRALPARGGEAHWQGLLHALAAVEPEGQGDPGRGLAAAAASLDRRGIVVWITDGLGDAEDAAHAVSLLRHRGHDVITLRVLDPAEIDFPYQRNTRFEDLEGDMRLRLDPNAVRSAYQEAFEAHARDLRRRLRALGCAFRRMRSDEPLEIGLVEFLARRSAALQRRGG
jgi:uncharacterized protein (DUF58 family)